MNTVLIDTSVWVAHFRHRSSELAQLLMQDRALIHPMVHLELACGTPPAPRARTLSDLNALPRAQEARPSEVLAFIEREHLYGLGCGLVDITLLASTLLSPGTALWTLDARLAALASRFGVCFEPAVH